MFCFKGKRSEAFLKLYTDFEMAAIFSFISSCPGFVTRLLLFVIWSVLCQSVIVRAFYFDRNMSSKIEIDHIPNFRRLKFFRGEVISQNNLKIPKFFKVETPNLIIISSIRTRWVPILMDSKRIQIFWIPTTSQNFPNFFSGVVAKN